MELSKRIILHGGNFASPVIEDFELHGFDL